MSKIKKLYQSELNIKLLKILSTSHGYYPNFFNIKIYNDNKSIFKIILLR